jgi:LacI family transcriptional regulator
MKPAATSDQIVVRPVLGEGSPYNPPARGTATINDVARLAKVSKRTVSRVINDSPLVKLKTRAAIQAIIADLQFSPDPQARGLARSKSFFIGLVYDNPNSQYVVNIQRGILDALVGTDFQLVLHPCDCSDSGHVLQVETFIQQHKPLGLILPPASSESEALADTLKNLEVDYVRIASVAFDEPSRMIRSMDFDGAAAAGRHLAARGHKNIAHIHGPANYRSTHERRSGFEAALKEAGLSLEAHLVADGGYTFEGGEAAADRLLAQEPRPDAVFAGNDEMAAGVYMAARKLGLRIPEDIAIVGFDDAPIAARVWPPMSTVRLPIRDMGHAAAKLLLRTAEGGASPETTTFYPEIIVRGSTVPIQKAVV